MISTATVNDMKKADLNKLVYTLNGDISTGYNQRTHIAKLNVSNSS